MFAVGLLILGYVIVSGALNLPHNAITRFFESYMIVPFLLIFVGRAQMRKARRQSDDQVPAEPVHQRPTPVRSSTPEPAPVTPRTTARAPIPTPTPTPMPIPVAPARPPVTVKSDTGKTSGTQPKSSEQMIAEAKQRLISKPRPGQSGGGPTR